MEAPLCAHRCDIVTRLTADLARRTGTTEAVVRVGYGLTRTPVPLAALAHPAPPRAGVACTSCGHVYDGPHAITAARECADLDTGTTD